MDMYIQAQYVHSQPRESSKSVHLDLYAEPKQSSWQAVYLHSTSGSESRYQHLNYLCIYKQVVHYAECQ